MGGTSGTGQKIADILAAIFFDINSICQARKIANQMPNLLDISRYRWECQGAGALVSQAVALALNPANSLSHEKDKYQQEPQRLAQLISRVGWKIVFICAHSEAFRRACKESETHVWDGVVGQIDANRLSIELFARTRNLEWRGPLLKHARHSLSELQREFAPYRKLCGEHPHHFVRTMDGAIRQPIYEGYPQVHINKCIFDPKDWEGEEDENGQITNPTIRYEDDGDCDLCGSEQICSCAPISLSGQLVELMDYPGKGVGVRALANFQKGSILDEFVGVIYPPNYEDYVYSASIHSQQQAEQEEIATISPKRYGNWTRFLNHSCNASCVFRELVIGDRIILAVEAVRDICILEEITVHYGDNYWTGGRKCQCGAANCSSLDTRTGTSTPSSD